MQMVETRNVSWSIVLHALVLLVAGDKNARYEAVLDVLDSIKQLDVKRVGLETVRKQ